MIDEELFKKLKFDAENFYLLTEVLHLEELIRLRRRLQKRGVFDLADYLSRLIQIKEEAEREEIERERKSNTQPS